MSQSISLTSGSILNGSPITLSVTPNNFRDVSMHRIILEVECGMSGGDYEIIKLSSPVITEGKAQTIDISSALRTFRDSYEYTPDPTTYPLVKFNVKAYDEYMSEGTVHQTQPIFYPIDPQSLPEERRDEAYLRTIFGAFSDLDRLTSSVTKGVTTLSRKPTTSPHLAVIGETFAYTPPYTTEQSLPSSASLTPPQSKVVTVTKAGLQTLGYQSIFALQPSIDNPRQQFRFINSFGVLESISVPQSHSKKLAIKSEKYAIARQETFNRFSRAAIRKQNNQESWLFQSDPLTEEWLYWYLHEFLMSEHVWMLLPQSSPSSPSSASIWLPCTITPDENTTILDRTKADTYTVSFTALLDINGSPLR